MSPLGLVLNGQFFRPIVNGLIAFSLRFLRGCSVHLPDRSSGYLSDFFHSSPLSPNESLCLDAVGPVNPRMIQYRLLFFKTELFPLICSMIFGLWISLTLKQFGTELYYSLYDQKAVIILFSFRYGICKVTCYLNLIRVLR